MGRTFISKQRFLLVVILSLVSLASCTQRSEQDVIRIGEVGSMSGAEATFGTSTHRGIELAIEEANKAGGIAGKQIRLITRDDQGKPEETATVAKSLISNYKVLALIGAVGSSKSMVMAPIAQQHKVPMVCPDSTNPLVTDLGDHIFRVCFIDPFQGEVMARFASEVLHAKTAAVLYDLKSDYSVGLAEFFVKTFEKNGGKILANQSYTAGDIDFKAQLTSIRSKNPQVLFLPGYYTEVGLISRQAKGLGITSTLLGGDGWDSPKLFEIGGLAVENSYHSDHYSPENQAPEVQEFITKFKQAYGFPPNGLAALGYDAARLLVHALKESPNLSSAEIQASLAKTKDFKGVTGKITFDSHRNPIKSAVILKAEQGAFKFQTTLAPR